MQSEGKHDYVPTWDGDPGKWEEFVITTETFLKQVEPWKESQQIARIINHFDKRGKPWRLLISLSESERAKLTTKANLFAYLKGNLLESAIPELGRHFRAWIKFKRDSGESMRVFILRHRQTLAKMEASLNQAQASADLKAKLRGFIDKAKLKLLSAEYAEKVAEKSKSRPEPKVKVWKSRAGPSNRRNASQVDEDPYSQEEEEDDGQWSAGQWSAGKWSSESKSVWWKGKWWENGWGSDKGYEAEPIKDKTEELSETLAQVELALEVRGKPEVMTKLVDLLGERWRETTIPDQLMGYHLLHASQLTATERSTILSTSQVQSRDSTGLTTLKGNLNLANIESALLTAWQDKELAERDQREQRKISKKGRNGKSYEVEGYDSDEGSEEQEINAVAKTGNGDSDTSSDEGINDVQLLEGLSDPEDAECFATALQVKFDAKQKYKTSKRTYQSARLHVRNIRKARRGRTFAVSSKDKDKNKARTWTKKSDKKDIAHLISQALHAIREKFPGTAGTDLCFKCGKKGHFARQCQAKGIYGLTEGEEQAGKEAFFINDCSENLSLCPENKLQIPTSAGILAQSAISLPGEPEFCLAIMPESSSSESSDSDNSENKDRKSSSSPEQKQARAAPVSVKEERASSSDREPTPRRKLGQKKPRSSLASGRLEYSCFFNDTAMLFFSDVYLCFWRCASLFFKDASSFLMCLCIQKTVFSISFLE